MNKNKIRNVTYIAYFKHCAGLGDNIIFNNKNNEMKLIIKLTTAGGGKRQQLKL